MTSIAIFGTGRIGGGIAARAASSGHIDHLVLYDCNQNLLNAQCLDIKHMGCPISISLDPSEIQKCDIVVFTAGIPRDPKVKTRADLLGINLPVIKEFTSYLMSFKGVAVIVSNPVDIMTWYFWKKTGINRKNIIGFGGELDSARFNYEASLSSLDGDGYVIGEHGEYQVPVFSKFSTPVEYSIRENILKKLQNSSMEIIKGKGGTEYAPVWHIWNLLHAIITDSHKRLICSSVLEGEYGFETCSLGMPVIIGKKGIEFIEKWDLDEWELNHLSKAAEFVSDICRDIRFD